jgi:transposase
MSDIGKRFAITRERVRQIFVREGIDTTLRPLSAEQEAAVADYVAGASLDQAACKAGVSAHSMRGWIIRAGHKVRPSKKARRAATVANAERAAQLYQSGAKMAEIAAAIGLRKPEMVYRLLAIAGVRPNRHAASRQAAAA